MLPPAGLLAFFLWGLLFAISYTQSPLYTSNQNQYFLQGLADAGYGELAEDWLANTHDPTPVFSGLVEYAYRVFPQEWVFYGLYALLMGVYFYSLWGIASQIYPQLEQPAAAFLFIALLIGAHSAAIRFFLARILGDNWTFVLEDGVADQRLLGLVLQPSAFGVFLVLGVYLFLRRKPVLAASSTAIAALFHPTYLLSAAVLTATFILVTLFEEKDWKKPLLAGGIALLLVMPSLLSTYQVFVGSAAEITEQARQVLVEYRIPHHALVSWWFDITAVLKIGIVVAAILLVRRRSGRLFWVLLVSSCSAVLLTLLQLASGSKALALLFPWRLSTYLVPLSLAVILAALVAGLANNRQLESGNWRKGVYIGSTMLVVACVLVGVARFSIDLQRRARDPERPIEGYVAVTLEPGENYLTPIKMQDFRLESGAPVFIEFKAIPYRAEEVLEWYRRVRLADRFYKSGDCRVLDEIEQAAPVTHVVEETSEQEIDCPGLDLVYSDASYRLFRITP